MGKEIIVSIVIIVCIVSLDIFTGKYTEKSAQDMSSSFTEIKNEVKKENVNKDIAKQKVNSAKEKWENYHQKLAYYIEHDELEKVDTGMTNYESFIETEDYSSAIQQLDEVKFVVEHIKHKNEFSLENIF